MISVRSLLVLLLAGAAFAGEPKRDRFGDPLPEGADARLGTVNVHLSAETIRFSPNGKSLVTHNSKSIRSWDAVTGRIKHIHDVPFDESAITQRVSDDGRVVVRMFSDKLVVDDVVLGKQCLSVPAIGSSVNALTGISPDGKWALVGFQNSTNNRGQLRIRSLEDGRVREWKEFDGVAKRVVFSPDGKLIALGTETLNDGFQCRRLSDGKVVARAFLCMLPLAFSPSGRLIAVAEQYGRWIEIWDVASGKALQLPRLRTQAQEPMENPVLVAAFSPDESMLATCLGSRLVIWNLTNGKAIRSWNCHANCLAFSPDGKSLATCDDLVRVWDVATGKPLTPDFGPLLTSDGDGRIVKLSNISNARIACWSRLWQRVQIWDTMTGTPGRRFSPISDDLKMAWLSRDATRLVTCAESSVQIWDANTGKVVTDLAPSPVMQNGQRLVTAARVVDGGDTLSVTLGLRADSVEAGNLARWDLRSHKLVSMNPIALVDQEESDQVESDIEDGIGISPDGRAAIWREHVCWVGDKSTRPLFFPNAGLRVAQQFPRSWLNNRIAYAVIRSNYSDATFVGVWELASARTLLQVQTQVRPIAAISDDGRWLALARLNSTELWDIATGKRVPFERTRQISPNAVHARSSCLNLAFLPDGKRLLAAYDDGTGLVWELPPTAQQPPALTMTEHTWDDLASLDARVGHQAVWAMRNESAKALKLLKKNLKPATMPPANELAALVEQLAASHYPARESASRRLRAYGPVIEPFVRDSLRRTSDPERKRRLNEILIASESVATRTPEEVRAIRCVEALEQMKDPEAKKLLHELSRGAPSAILTQEARGASER